MLWPTVRRTIRGAEWAAGASADEFWLRGPSSAGGGRAEPVHPRERVPRQQAHRWLTRSRCTSAPPLRCRCGQAAVAIHYVIIAIHLLLTVFHYVITVIYRLLTVFHYVITVIHRLLTVFHYVITVIHQIILCIHINKPIINQNSLTCYLDIIYWRDEPTLLAWWALLHTEKRLFTVNYLRHRSVEETIIYILSPNSHLCENTQILSYVSTMKVYTNSYSHWLTEIYH
jgi:hypothetical protein